MVPTHSNHGKKKECGQEVMVQTDRALWIPAESGEKMTVSEVAVESRKKEGIR